MNYTITGKIEERLNKKYNIVCELESSKSSDYIKLPSRDGFSNSIRISNHDPLTGRSACALISLEPRLFRAQQWEGKFETTVNWDDDFEMMEECGDEIAFDTKEECEKHIFEIVMKEIDRIVRDNQHVLSFNINCHE